MKAETRDMFHGMAIFAGFVLAVVLLGYGVFRAGYWAIHPGHVGHYQSSEVAGRWYESRHSRTWAPAYVKRSWVCDTCTLPKKDG